jgi:hypothetical protein
MARDLAFELEIELDRVTLPQFYRHEVKTD